MIHQPSLGGHIQGVSADMEIHAEQILRVKEMGARILAENTGQTIERIKKTLKGTTGWTRKPLLNTALWTK